jgi:riboflavin biosynthesis pyrimidine reductase
MSVTANLVVGSDGSTIFNGGSRGLSTAADRAQFLAQRRNRDCIIIGGKTALTKDYDRSPCPVIVLSHSHPSLLDRNPAALWWNLSPREAISKAQIEFGSNIGVEAGQTLLLAFLKLKLIDVLDLSVTTVKGGDARLDIALLLSFFAKVERSEIAETVFYHCSSPMGNPQN